MNRLRKLAASLAFAGAVCGAAAASTEPAAASPAAPAPAAALSGAIYDPAQPAVLEQAQWRWGGRRYCWYARGWRGPGWYVCGFGGRRGRGWGGPGGWHGWRWRGRSWRGGRWR